MNIEELEKEAQEFELANTTYDVVESNGKERTKKVCDITVQEAYVAGAEPREKRIAELEQQIEKMKCCDNCANEDREDFYDDTWHNDICVNCKNNDKWELRK